MDTGTHVKLADYLEVSREMIKYLLKEYIVFRTYYSSSYAKEADGEEHHSSSAYLKSSS